jgi:ribosomal protein L11 methyltransferase
MRARMLALFPEGFEESDRDDAVELSAYTDGAGEDRARSEFGDVLTAEVPADWEERWKRFHRAAHVAGLWVGPPWLTPPQDVVAVVVEPGRAFGTGAHPTTRLCIEVLSSLEAGSLLDVGCGSGVLSIAAAKLGHGPIVAVDAEEAAIEATERNARANGVTLEAVRADALVDDLPSAATAVANIDATRSAAVAARVECERLVTSGYFAPHVPDLPGYRHILRQTDEGWAADLFEPQ